MALAKLLNPLDHVLSYDEHVLRSMCVGPVRQGELLLLSVHTKENDVLLYISDMSCF